MSNGNIYWELTKMFVDDAVKLRVLPPAVIQLEGVSKEVSDKFMLLFSMDFILREGLLEFDKLAPESVLYKAEAFEISYSEYLDWVQTEFKNISSKINKP